VVMFGTDAQKEEWLPKLASGEIVASFALTEPGAGSDAASVRTAAIRDGDHYVVNGTKRYITNANRAGMFTLLARSDPSKKGATGISAFIVPAKTPGITIGKPEKKMGLPVCVSARKAKASRSRCRSSIAAACTSRPSASVLPNG
jgi:acyl-CoA dehydrogenase